MLFLTNFNQKNCFYRCFESYFIMKKGLIIFEHIFRIPVIVHSAVRWGKNASKRTERHGEVFKRIFFDREKSCFQLVLRPHFFCGLFLSDMVTKKSVLLSCSRRHHQNAQWNQSLLGIAFKFSIFQKFCELGFFLWNWLKCCPCPFIQILCKFYPDFLKTHFIQFFWKLTLSKFYPDFILIFEKIWIKFG